ncbi:MAG: 16S rRNA (uracil(1498)-N(3))-methyltransferase [Proteobacteria bacterium]|nr:16S rRNA (uracil(1498)-N(3))-methyltransferase [Pseudomonadota bacterium]
MSNHTQPHTWPRLYIHEQIKAVGQPISLAEEQSRYLLNVMRLRPGDSVRLFNGQDGEYIARARSLPQKKKEPLILHTEKLYREQIEEPDLWLCCAPIRKAFFDYTIMKSTELGVSVIQPYLTSRTQVRDINLDHLQRVAIEAAEQSERLTVPEIRPLLRLDQLLSTWPSSRLALVCAEYGQATPIACALQKPLAQSRPKAAIFTGPEGGYTESELTDIMKLDESCTVRLGPRILRADTAALAALSCWQSLCGDWRTHG